MQLVLKKATFETVPVRRRRGAIVFNNNEVKNPGSRGSTHWYYDKNHQVQYGDPPSGHTGFNSGDFHQMFIKHTPKMYHDKVHATTAESEDYGMLPATHASRAMSEATQAHSEDIRFHQGNHIFDKNSGEKTQKTWHNAVNRMGKMLDAAYEGAMKHGFDKDSLFVSQYRNARRIHAIHMIDAGKFTVTPPTAEELKALPVPKDHEELQDMATTYLPQVHFDIEKMDLEIADQLVFQLLTVIRDYDPKIATNLRHFGTRTSNEYMGAEEHNWNDHTEMAHMTMDGQVLAINPNFAWDAWKFRDEVAESHMKGWLVSPDVKDVVTHEFGHAVDFFYSRNPQWDNLMIDWKIAHRNNVHASLYAKEDDRELELIQKEFEQTGQRPKDYRDPWERNEQWAESFVSLNRHKPEQQKTYTIHMRRLIDFIHENPTFDASRDEIDRSDLEHLGFIQDPIYIRVKGESYD